MTYNQEEVVSEQELRNTILELLMKQGYKVTETGIQFEGTDKEAIRKAHALAVQAEIQRAKQSLQPYESRLLSYIANGDEVVPSQIRPVLVPVSPDTEFARLFRYACLHWSIPISNGYGRRLRFLILDEYNGKLMGILGLGDPVFSLSARDRWVGWDFEQRKKRLFHVMDAFVLGAVPPYSRLLAGKFVAMIATCREVSQVFHERYTGRQTVLRKRSLPAHLVLVTTTSALGRSSIYNRLKFHGRYLMKSVGYTVGWGTFHFSNGVYEQMRQYAYLHCKGTAKAEGWGGGEFRNRYEVIRKCLIALGFPDEWMHHQVRREVFVAPLAENTREFLCGETDEVYYNNCSYDEYFAYYRERWLLPRAERDSSFRNFNREEWRLWK